MLGGGGTGPVEEMRQHLSEAQRTEIKRELRDNKSKLRRRGELRSSGGLAPVMFSWPVRAADLVTDYGVDAISGFVDHDSSYPNQLLDYYCGARTYDTGAGYNHKGLDISTWPFSWIKMANDDVEVVAAASGQIIGKETGHDDASCSLNGETWNAVYVLHADGSEAWYGHMKKGSLTEKEFGDSVVAGEYLGVVGSSGNSTGPHLHLEVYDNQDDLVDPYAGACNSLNVDSWWTSQPDYYEPRVNKIATGSAAPDFNSCPNPATTNIKKTFEATDTIYFVTYYRDLLDTATSEYTIRRPDGTIYAEWDYTSIVPHFQQYYRYNYYSNFESESQTGIWRYEVAYASKYYQTDFYVVDQCSSDITVNDPTISNQVTYAASGTVSTSGQVAVTPSGDATLLAGNSIALGSGFSVQEGGRLRLRTDPLVCD